MNEGSRGEGLERRDEIPMDLSALDPSVEPQEWEGLVAGIMVAAGPELARRQAARFRGRGTTPGPLGALAQWTRPILAAAAVVALISTGLLQWAPVSGGGDTAQEGALLSEVLGLPSTVALWLEEERAPTAHDLVLALEEDAGWP